MSWPLDQIEALRRLCDSLAEAEECGTRYLLLRGLRLPDGCQPASVDALLCPTGRDGYASRLFFAEQVPTKQPRNWNGTVRILERTWHGMSWKVQPGLDLVAMLGSHLRALV